MLELITDRTQNDVVRLTNILLKRSEDRTPEEQEELDSAASKGAYNYTDLNRVTSAMEYLNQVLNKYGYSTRYSPISIPHQGGSRLPDGYLELEYIEATGTQYIETNYTPSSTTKVTAKFQLSQKVSENLCLFGVAGQFSFRWFGSLSIFRSNSGDNKDFPTSIDPIAVHNVSKTATECSIDDEYTVTNTVGTVSASLLIFAQKTTSLTAQNFFKGRVFSFSIYDGTDLLHDYVPCKNSDGEVGLYDLVSKTFLKNVGTGSFIEGPTVTTSISDSELDPSVWYEKDVPTLDLMQKYLQNIEAIRETLGLLSSTPETPSSMEYLNCSTANDIEQILLDVERAINLMTQTFVACGPATCGGDYL